MIPCTITNFGDCGCGMSGLAGGVLTERLSLRIGDCGGCHLFIEFNSWHRHRIGFVRLHAMSPVTMAGDWHAHSGIKTEEVTHRLIQLV